jgi:hypothetical protein
MTTDWMNHQMMRNNRDLDRHSPYVWNDLRSGADCDVAKDLHLEEVMAGRKRYKVAARTNSMEK